MISNEELGIPSQEILDKLHAHSLTLLKEFDRICKKYNIQYFLAFGTAIGAARHKGFIPWDDDIDLIMLRHEYEKLDKVIRAEIIDPLIWISWEEAHERCPCARLMDTSKTLVLQSFIDADMPQGLNIDIFIYDNKPKNSIWLSCLWIFKFASSPQRFNNVFIDSCLTLANKLFARKNYNKLRDAFIQKNKNNKSDVLLYWPGRKTYWYTKWLYPLEWFKESVPIEFEGGQYPIMSGYHEWLTREYGDYMTPPPPQERRPLYFVNAFVDLDTPYTKYMMRGKDGKISWKFNTDKL